MGIKDDLTTKVKDIFTGGKWEEEETDEVPDAEDLPLAANHAKYIKSATVLYADIDGSTTMVDSYKWWFSAEVYKAYLRCASELIRSEDGKIRAYDGDRVMAIFAGDLKNTRAVRCALKINAAVEDIIQPTIKSKYTTDFSLKHVIGIDTSGLHAAKIGVHGENDLVWVGRAANHAAKLCALSTRPIWITKDVHTQMIDDVKLLNGVSMWEAWTWNTMANAPIYSSTYKWVLK